MGTVWPVKGRRNGRRPTPLRGTVLNHAKNQNVVSVVPTPLGWLALVGCGRVLKQLTFGYPSEAAALAALAPELLDGPSSAHWNRPLVRRLLSYLSGKPVDFDDVLVDTGPRSDFQRRVLEQCRRICYGQTLSYGQLAAKGGSAPAPARAVGNCMAGNAFPLVVPCHRVVPSSGGVGSYSAPGCAETKRRLLAMESAGQAETRNRRQMLVHAKAEIGYNSISPQGDSPFALAFYPAPHTRHAALPTLSLRESMTTKSRKSILTLSCAAMARFWSAFIQLAATPQVARRRIHVCAGDPQYNYWHGRSGRGGTGTAVGLPGVRR